MAFALTEIANLIGANFGVSFAWSGETARLDRSLCFNLEPKLVRKYLEWFYPSGLQIRSRRLTNFAEKIILPKNLLMTEAQYDLQCPDRPRHAVSMFIYQEDKPAFDLKMWRREGRPDFTSREIGLLNSLKPFLTRALQREIQYNQGLTPRECDVATLVARGCTDRDIARVLGIGFGTVRTHVNKALQKRSCANRAELAASMGRGR